MVLCNLAASHPHQLGEDRKRNLLWSYRAQIEPRRRIDGSGHRMLFDDGAAAWPVW